jgi:hypothetical protein
LGQKHYSGTYWSSTVSGPVIYESRLELARLLFADFDHRVLDIVAQPFLLRAAVDQKARKHVPDYLVITDTGHRRMIDFTATHGDHLGPVIRSGCLLLS